MQASGGDVYDSADAGGLAGVEARHVLPDGNMPDFLRDVLELLATTRLCPMVVEDHCRTGSYSYRSQITISFAFAVVPQCIVVNVVSQRGGVRCCMLRVAAHWINVYDMTWFKM